MEVPAKKAKKRKQNVSYGKWGYIFILPFFLTFLIFQLIPLISTVYYSFFEYYRDGLTVVGPNFVGLENYKTLQKIEVKVGKYHGKEDALKLIEVCKERYLNEQKK